ncbi:sirohydrochlorin cobaltochelatase [Oikeobacillus pervagus]|uniref:Sirohydrochlorin cobaltochelatase n=1 Tax=Oikeobacillus pervagus TaxID=1325931 RepID=A0AAJ1WIB4_9BACI|nr:sirohydrochlorin chelatase [Oikeobacillus pervagus]MDQ0214233.1 sirohydrochlorin cobaltochelatase [Oikeobacillus pervagus]
MKAVLFVGHGSRDHEGNEQIRIFIRKLQPQIDENILVETCFLEFEKPTVSDGLKACVSKGATSVAVIPIMLLPAGHSKIHIPFELDEAKKKYPHVSFTYGRPIGVHELTIDICKSRLQEIGEPVEAVQEEAAVILLGRGGSDPDANSDLYKISRLLWERLNYPLVEPAFMGVTTPLIDETVERCIKLGAKKITILPYFLFTGILIKRLEKMVEDYQSTYPHIQFQLAGYFGFHEKLQQILLDRMNEALQGQVVMNCDTCQYRLGLVDHIDHHHHHDHDHDDDHHHDHHHEEVTNK